MARSFMATLPDPDTVGESLYRALHEELTTWFETMPGQDQGEIAADFARDLREAATMIDNKVKAYEKESN
jgi:hypothetical protein